MTAIQQSERRSRPEPGGPAAFLIAYRGLRGPTHALHYGDAGARIVVAPFERHAMLAALRLPPGDWTLESAMQWAEFMAPGWVG